MVHKLNGRDQMVRPIIFILGESGKYPRYEAAIRMAGGEVLAETCWKDAGRCDALLLPGGGDLEPWRYGEANTASRNLDPVRDQQEYLLMQQFAVLRRPILGICRGLQTINVYFGGSLLQDIPGHSTVGDIDRLHRVRTVPSLLRELYGEEGIVNSAHHQGGRETGSRPAGHSMGTGWNGGGAAAYGASSVGRSMASGAFGSGTGGNCRRRAAVSGIFTACWEKMKRKMNLPLDRMRFPCYPN